MFSTFPVRFNPGNGNRVYIREKKGIAVKSRCRDGPAAAAAPIFMFYCIIVELLFLVFPKISRLSAEYERSAEEAHNEATSLREKLDGLSSTHRERVLELEEKLKEAEKDKESIKLELQEELR